jgi:hypothetical protein
MSELVLHPRAAPGDRLRVWVGALGRTAAPALAWTVDGAPAQPLVVRALASARDDAGPDAMVAATTVRAFTGIFEFAGPTIVPASAHRVEVKASDGGHAGLDVRTLPAEVPTGLDRTFNVLLVSCFHRTEDREGLAGNLVAALPDALRPDVTLLLGDQVYLDLPALADFKARRDWLSQRFENDYVANWRGPDGYARVLQAAPTVATPDDHEYWNDFPRAQPHIRTTWSESGRAAWQASARSLYDAFQANPLDGRAAFELDVPPLSLFVLDTRTDRTASRARIVAPAALAQFRAWIDRLLRDRLIGLVASGQSFLDPPAGKLALDLMLANFEDYNAIVGEMRRAFEGGIPLVLVTGDVHWGRVVEILDAGRMRSAGFEVISSPSSLVTSIGLDQIRTIGAAIGRLFGRRNPWPRHSDARDPESHFAQRELGARFPIARVHRQKGNMVALLSFRRTGFGLELRVRYFPIHRKPTAPVPDLVSRPLVLTSA